MAIALDSQINHFSKQYHEAQKMKVQNNKITVATLLWTKGPPLLTTLGTKGSSDN